MEPREVERAIGEWIMQWKCIAESPQALESKLGSPMTWGEMLDFLRWLVIHISLERKEKEEKDDV